jgi:hypothetical protein
VRQAIQMKYPSWGEEQTVRRLAEYYGVGRLTAQMRKVLLG